jgi:hypothetical protein
MVLRTFDDATAAVEALRYLCPMMHDRAGLVTMTALGRNREAAPDPKIRGPAVLLLPAPAAW